MDGCWIGLEVGGGGHVECRLAEQVALYRKLTSAVRIGRSDPMGSTGVNSENKSAPVDESAEPAAHSKLFADAHKNVMNFISGRRGKAVILEMFQLVRSFADEGWNGLSISDDVKFELSEAMLAGMADSFHRLVFIYLDPRWKVFGVCESTIFDDALIRHIVAPLLVQMQTCPRCKDLYFAWPWLQRLCHDDVEIRRKAHRCLLSVVPTLPVTAVKCEKKHLLGQETRAQKRRGRALACTTLMKVTYAKSVHGAWKRAREIVLGKHSGGTAGKRKWSQALRSFRTGKRQQKKPGHKVKLRGTDKRTECRTRKQSAYYE